MSSCLLWHLSWQQQRPGWLPSWPPSTICRISSPLHRPAASHKSSRQLPPIKYAKMPWYATPYAICIIFQCAGCTICTFLLCKVLVCYGEMYAGLVCQLLCLGYLPCEVFMYTGCHGPVFAPFVQLQLNIQHHPCEATVELLWPPGSQPPSQRQLPDIVFAPFMQLQPNVQ